MAIAVLPVLRSPMISSRWPRPIGVMASIALMPVCIGSSTGCRSAMPGAVDSTSRGLCSVTIGPLLSIGSPSGLTTRPIIASPTGTRSSSPVAVTVSPSWICGVVAQDDHADGRLFEVERQPLDAVLERDHLAGHHAREAVDPGDAVADLEHLPDLGPGDLGLELLDLTLDD